MRPLCGAALAASLMTGPALAGCGDDAAACELGDRVYHIELPETPADGNPALVFLHGYGSTGAGTMRNLGMVNAALARGYAVVAPTGLPMGQGRNGSRWDFRGPNKTIEFDFLKDLRAELSNRFEIDADNTLLAGFSNGAFLVAYLACEDPEAFPAYAAVAGGFWRPDPESCAGPVNLHMTHGWRDGVVPLEGRILRGESRDDPEAAVQGDIFRTLELFRIANDCTRNRPEIMDQDGDYWIRTWQSCADDAALSFAMHGGGHMVPQGWVDLTFDWFEAL